MLTLPASLPLWLVGLVLIGFAVLVRGLVRPIIFFWNAPPRRHSASYYGYRTYKRSSRHTSVPKIAAETDPPIRLRPVEFPPKRHIEFPKSEVGGRR